MGPGTASLSVPTRTYTMSGTVWRRVLRARIRTTLPGTLASLDTGAGVVTYDFDSLGRLTDYNSEVSYTYDGLDRVAARNGTSFVYEGGSLDPISDGTFAYGRSPSGRLVSQANADGTNAMLAGLDAHGDLSFLYSAAGVVSDTAMFDPFGEPVSSTGTTSPTLGFQADLRIRYRNMCVMVRTLRVRSRWCDGGWAVFLSRDTVFEPTRLSQHLNKAIRPFPAGSRLFPVASFPESKALSIETAIIEANPGFLNVNRSVGVNRPLHNLAVRLGAGWASQLTLPPGTSYRDVEN